MEQKKLYFKSFRNAHRIFDLSDYLEEASEQGTIDFLNLPCLYFEGTAQNLAKEFTKSQMRKVPKIIALGYLDKYAPAELQKRAQQAKPPITLEVKDNKLLVSKDSNRRAVFLDFLSNSILSSHLDDSTDYKSENHRPVKSD